MIYHMYSTAIYSLERVRLYFKVYIIHHVWQHHWLEKHRLWSNPPKGASFASWHFCLNTWSLCKFIYSWCKERMFWWLYTMSSYVTFIVCAKAIQKNEAYMYMPEIMQNMHFIFGILLGASLWHVYRVYCFKKQKCKEY